MSQFDEDKFVDLEKIINSVSTTVGSEKSIKVQVQDVVATEDITIAGTAKTIPSVRNSVSSNFSSSADYTFDSSYVTISGGSAYLKDQTPTNAVLGLSYLSNINPNNWSGGTPVITAIGGAAVENGKLNLSYGDLRYITYNYYNLATGSSTVSGTIATTTLTMAVADPLVTAGCMLLLTGGYYYTVQSVVGVTITTTTNLSANHTNVAYQVQAATERIPLAQTGCVRFNYTPDYSGTPTTNMEMFWTGFNQTTSWNELAVRHRSTGNLEIRLFSSAGASIAAASLGVWNPTSGITYEIEMNWDATAGATRLFVNGTQFGATQVGTGTRNTNTYNLRVGAVAGTTPTTISNFKIDKLIFFTAVQHTANYTAGYTMPETKYSLSQDISMNSDFSTALAYSYVSITETSTKPTNTNIKYQYSSDAGVTYNGTWLSPTDVWDDIDSITCVGDGTDTLRFKFNLTTTDGASTPILDNLLLLYETTAVFSTATNTKVSIGVASTSVLSANVNRKYAIFVNDSANVIYLSLSGTAVLNEGIRLNSLGGAFEINLENLYRGAVSGISSVAASNLTICEG